MKGAIQWIIVGVIVFTVGISSAEVLPKTHLKVVGYWSSVSAYKNYEQPFWSKEITEKSGGAITAEIKGFNEMGLKGPEILRMIKQGVIEFGTSTMGYFAGDDPRNELIDLAGLNPDIETARKVTNAYRPVLEKLYKDKFNAKILGIWANSAQVFFSKGPISGLADLKGKKIRVSERTRAEFVEAFGAASVTVPFSEVVQAMQLGVVDGAITGAMSGYLAKWYEVSNYLYALPVGWSQTVHAVNLTKWNKLDPKIQNLLVREIKGLEDRIWKAADEETQQGYACNTGQGKCEFGQPGKMKLVQMTDADRTAMNKVFEEVVLRKWIERSGKTSIEEFNNTVGKVVNIKAR